MSRFLPVSIFLDTDGGGLGLEGSTVTMGGRWDFMHNSAYEDGGTMSSKPD